VSFAQRFDARDATMVGTRGDDEVNALEEKTQVDSETAHLKVGDKELELPVIVGTEQEKALDIAALRAKTGYVTLDEGFVNTGSTSSSITFLDGEKRNSPISRLSN
jgi:hypothetical protein